MESEEEFVKSGADRLRATLRGIRTLLRAAPLVLVLLLLAHLLTERKGFFPDNSPIGSPPEAEYLAFPPEKPALGKGEVTTEKVLVAHENQPGADKTGRAKKPGKEKTEAAKPGTIAATGGKTPDGGAQNPPVAGGAGKPVAGGTTTPVPDGTQAGKTVAPTTEKTAVAAGQTAGTINKPQLSKQEISGPVEGGYIVIYLSRRFLGLVANQQYVRAYYNISVPENLTEPKSDKYDNRAPVGDYYVCAHEVQGNVMTLVLNYPSPADAGTAFKSGKIAKGDYDLLIKAAQQKFAPPFNTPLGGPILIRGDGGGNKKIHGSDIGITPAEMEELWLATRKGTPVRILK